MSNILWTLKGPYSSALWSRTNILMVGNLTSKAVQSTSLSLQSIDDVHSGDSFPLGMLSVGDSVTNNIFQENLEHTSGLFINETRDTFDTTSSGQTTNSGLGDTLDIIS